MLVWRQGGNGGLQEEKVQRAFGRLQHQEVVGRVQTGQAGLGWGDPPILWSRASKAVAQGATGILDEVGGERELGILLETGVPTQFHHQGDLQLSALIPQPSTVVWDRTVL